MKLLGAYKNGNTEVEIYDDGTKIRKTENAFWAPEFPESIDLKITNKCNHGCSFCHEDSKPDGKHADLNNIEFLKSLHPYTELAVGGGNPLLHPELNNFLSDMKARQVICNMTVKQEDFVDHYGDIINWMHVEYLHGIGVSLSDAGDKEFIKKIQSRDNFVVHIVCGVTPLSELEKLYDKNLKILFLGFKDFRRGHEYKSVYPSNVGENILNVRKSLSEIRKHFKVISFDNLAIEQLNPRKLLDYKEWEEFYMGDDGQFTMFIDAVEEEFARNSISTKRYKLTSTIDEMFKILHKEGE